MKSNKRAWYLLVLVITIGSLILGGCNSLHNKIGRPNNYYNKDAQEQVFKKTNGDNQSVGKLVENPIIKTADENVSTFSIDVDTASYVNFRKHIKEMTLEEFRKNNYSIRTEEAVNYFNYNYEKPTGDVPIAVTTTVGDCPWNTKAKLAMITVAGKEIDRAEQAGSNIVFLVDVSGSMDSDEKLPLLKQALTIAIENLSEKDTVSMVTYASGVQTIMNGIKGNNKSEIINALNSLQSGGSTAGASGLELAYSVAEDYFIKGGNNRIILATDGDFNVGPSSVEEVKRIVTKRRESGIFLTVLGFGVNYYSGDSRLEALADNGNGGFYVIDGIDEGKRILSDQFSGTLYTIAKDVKLQVEFNKEQVESYRLIGYENRVLNNEDFEDDTVDAGDMGSGHNVTALYEIVLKEKADQNLFTVQVRYKNPDSNKSELYTHDAKLSTEVTSDFKFASAVVEACLVINNSEYKGKASLTNARKTANDNAGNDSYKKEFVKILQELND